MTLKTLKDFETKDNFVKSWEIKHEAIQHIKAIQKKIDLIDKPESEISNNSIQSFRGKINWIKWFFNITEEDLK